MCFLVKTGMIYFEYLIANDRDYRWGLVTTAVGVQEIGPGAVYPVREHPDAYMFSTKKDRILQEFVFLYIYEGSGWFASAHCKKTRVKAGDMCLIFPNEWHSYAPDKETGWAEAWIGCKGTIPQQWIDNGFFTPDNAVLNIGMNNQLLDYFNRAYEVARQQSPAYQQMLAGYVGMISSTVYSACRGLPYKCSPVIKNINRAKRFMHDNICENISMEEVARYVGIGYSKFRKDFKQITGLSPNQYFIEMKLERSKTMLLNEEISCKEVAFSLGFDSPPYFTKVFRSHTGLTPQEFRNRHL